MLSVPFLIISSLLLGKASTFFAPMHNTDSEVAFGIPFDMWYCGSGDSMRKHAVSVINSTCPTAAVDFNHCCAVHDECYSNQRGRNDCDYDFCHCIKDVVKKDSQAENCTEHSDQVCGLVRLFGGVAYNGSMGSSIAYPPVKQRRIPEIKKISSDYVTLYEKCPYQSKTLGSCALNYDICTNRTTRNCELGLLRCLENTQLGRNGSDTCDKAMEDILSKIIHLNDTQIIGFIHPGKMQKTTIIQKVWRKMSRPSNPMFVFMLIFASLFFVSILTIVLCTRIDNRIVLDDPSAVVVPVTSSRASAVSQSSSRI